MKPSAGVGGTAISPAGHAELGGLAGGVVAAAEAIGTGVGGGAADSGGAGMADAVMGEATAGAGDAATAVGGGAGAAPAHDAHTISQAAQVRRIGVNFGTPDRGQATLAWLYLAPRVESHAPTAIPATAARMQTSIQPKLERRAGGGGAVTTFGRGAAGDGSRRTGEGIVRA